METERGIRKVIVGRSRLILEEPFFEPLVMKLTLVEDPRAKKMWTDGVSVGVNPEWAADVSLDEIRARLCEITMHCFPAGTYIAGDDKPIEHFAIGDEVIGRGGIKRRVIQRSARHFKGQLYTIKARGLLPIEMTKEHPVLVTQSRWAHAPRPSQRMYHQWSMPTWKPAAALSEADWVFIPRIEGTETIKRLKFNYQNPWSVKPQMRNGLILDEEIAEFIGWYVAEGWTTAGSNQLQIGLAMHERETPIAQNLISMLRRRTGYSAKIWRRSGRGIDVRFASAPLGRFLSDRCGKGARNKRIPEFILYHKNLNLLRAFLRGYMAGDGYITQTAAFGTASKILAMQLQLAFARFGILMNLSGRKQLPGKINGKTIHGGYLYLGNSSNQRVFDLFEVPRPVRRQPQHFGELEGHLLTPIQAIATRDFEGQVFNFETEQHTYTAGNIVTHNCANGHGWRMSGRDPTDWNRAADFSLWSLLKNAGYPLPPDVHYDAKYDGKSPEFIYEQIHVEPPPQPPQAQPGADPGGQGEQAPDQSSPDTEQAQDEEDGSDQQDQEQPEDPGSDGEIRPPPMNVDRDELANDWQQAVIQAAAAAQAQGRLPAGLKQFVELITKPAIPWQETLRKLVQQIIAKADYSWRRPNRRFITQKIYMPEIRSERMPAGVVYWDTSGSMDDQKSRAKCAGETGSIIDECRPEKLFIIYGDAKVQHVDEFEPGDPIEFHPKGGGGTDFRPIFEYIEKEQLEPAFFIGITDLYGTFPTKAPDDYPVIWCATTKAEAPFGEIIRLPQEK